MASTSILAVRELGVRVSVVAERRLHRLSFRSRLLAAVVGIAVIVLIPLIGKAIAPASPYSAVGSPLAPPSLSHLMGTDALGRDVFSRLLIGSRTTLMVGFSATALALLVGATIGVFAGTSQRAWVDEVLTRPMDVLLALPEVLLVLFVLAFLGTSVEHLVAALALAAVPYYARIARAVSREQLPKAHVEAAIACGAKRIRIVRHHILPPLLPALIAAAPIGVATAILLGSALSFLGLGAQPPHPEWGAMLSESRPYWREAWWLPLFPGFALIAVILILNLASGALRRALNPQSNV